MKERKDTKKIEKRQRNCDKGIINGKGFEEERYFGEESMRRRVEKQINQMKICPRLPRTWFNSLITSSSLFSFNIFDQLISIQKTIGLLE